MYLPKILTRQWLNGRIVMALFQDLSWLPPASEGRQQYNFHRGMLYYLGLTYS